MKMGIFDEDIQNKRRKEIHDSVWYTYLTSSHNEMSLYIGWC